MHQDKNKVFRLLGKIMHYDWGGTSFLPDLLQIPNPENRPFAEYWLGAHVRASSELLMPAGGTVLLNEYTRAFPKQTLGEYVTETFGQLPYLLKVLDVNHMLSIQVHPSKKNAEKEFLDENDRGIALTAITRNYKDANHKPEMLLALSEFWLLHGFKPAEGLINVLNRIPELHFLLEVFEKKGYQALYSLVMEMPQTRVNETLQPLIKRLIPAYQENRLNPTQEDFWVARAAQGFSITGNIDRGIFSIYLFNLVHLREGEALYQGAGLPHAYLEGQNIEIMANSDNVLRGGLTSKHIDVKELMKHIEFQQTIPAVQKSADGTGHFQIFSSPAPDFVLGRIKLQEGHTISFLCNSAEIYFVLKGRILLRENEQDEIPLKMGQAFIGFDHAAFGLKAEEESILIRAAVPLLNDL